MGKLSFELVWERICAQERKFFKTHQNEHFTYRIEDGVLIPSHSDARIPRADFEMTFPMLPLPDPRKIAKFVKSYPHVAAILGDPRISQGDW